MFFTHAGRSSLLSLLLFSNHNHPFFFSSLLLFHTLLLYTHVHLAYTHMSRRRQRRRRRDFPPLSIHTSRGKRGRERKRIGGRRWWTMFSSFSIGQSHYKFFLLTDTLSTRYSSMSKISKQMCIEKCQQGWEMEERPFTHYLHFLFFYSHDYISVNDVNRKHK
jgi:hypothetical protein